MRIHDPIVVSSTSAFPGLGNLLGTGVGTDVFRAINADGHKSFFGSDFDDLSNRFYEKYVIPMNRVDLELSHAVNNILNPDRIRPLIAINDFKAIPLCMEMAICLYPPVRQGIEEGRMEGFGYIPDSLPTEDVFGRMIENFRCDDVLAASDDDGYFPLSGTMYSDDPDLSDDELDAIEATRNFIRNKILRETMMDPTCIELDRG